MSIFSNFLTFNIDYGGIEAQVHGLRKGLLTTEDYGNLTQCESLDDVKLHLSGTDYQNFLQNEPSPLTPAVVVERATDKLVKQFNEFRFHAVEPLSRFLDFITYEYMINNVLKLIVAVRNGRGALDLLYKCHPLGLFPSIGVVTVATSVSEMFELVLIDSPIGKFFISKNSEEAVKKKDLDELATSQIKAWLNKNYLEAFYDFCRNIGGTTAKVMSKILEFEADRAVLTITRQSCKAKDISPDERRSLYPNFGTLVDFYEELSDAKDDKAIKKVLEESTTHQHYYDIFQTMEDTNGKISFNNQMLKMEAHLNKLSFCEQFHFGHFYSIVKLRQQEISNLMWITECIHQDMKSRINEYIPLYSGSGFKP